MTQTPPLSGVIPYIGLNGRAAEASAFWTRAFGATEVARMPSEDPDRLIHLQMEINGGGLMASDMSDPASPYVPPQGFHLQIVVDDADAWWARALEAGCEVSVPLQTMFWGDRWGMVVDPFGLLWAVDEPAAGEA
ncbi:VOC family protein [Albimonas pacifica]|uniref:PhnB protein n=1 Tax=Albimonas pacifica TaxID=1114924 RepID=A0A1I3PDB2_9RHOB|nr:glyoxalase/bleomycin resistance/extradiol dioxygenase family protein [Albimonas pacifica]SFJ19452.1 PhnB protein [Albimonas pacifica]